MARSRRGGTSGLLSGKVGDVIYSVTRNPDGSFRQSVSANPASRENPNTDAQARARLTMATVERAMFTFRDMMGSGFEGVDAGTNSVSKFSEVNYNFFKDKVLEGWDDPEADNIRLDLPSKGSSIPKDGEFIISQGSLRPVSGFTGTRSSGSRVGFNYQMVSLVNYNTLKEALWETRINIGDQIACFFYGIGKTPAQSFIVWYTMWTDPGFPPTTIITPDTWQKYIHFASNVPYRAYYDSQVKHIRFQVENLQDWGLSNWGSIGYRRRAVMNGKICYSTQQMQNRWRDPWTEQGWQTIADVKQSWLL